MPKDVVRKTVIKHSMLLKGDRVLVGLSGGPDSVCLLHILNALRDELSFSLAAAYIDHGLRPEETPEEISFCSGLCNSLGIPFFSRSVDVTSLCRERRTNKQEAARELRYQALREISSEAGANRLALGHNADDQMETVIMRLIRGAGPSGLSGIPPVRGDIIRPLIETERRTIEEFLRQGHCSWMTDSSNLTDDYSRNRLRNRVIPELKGLGREITGTICRMTEILREEEQYFEILVTKRLMRLISRKSGSAIELFSSPLEAMEPVILRRVLRRVIEEVQGLRGIDFIHIEEIMQLIRTGRSGDRITLPGKIRAVKEYSTLVITTDEPGRLSSYTFIPPERLILKEVSLVVESRLIQPAEAGELRAGGRTAFFDADKLASPLLVRGRQAGDFFFPLGFGKRKKLQDFFVDEKIPRDERDTVPLLISEGRIAWIMGYRMDERFKVDKATRSVLQLEIKPGKG